MDQIIVAARSGDVQLLHQLLGHNPFLLSDHSINNSNENPLTIAIKANQLTFSSEILMLNSQLAFVQNQDGTRPLDVAAAYGNVEMVKQILMLAPDTCRLTGRDGWTAIHYAAVNGNIEIISELLSACSDCVKDVTVFGETAIHLAIKYFKFEAVKCILEWLEKVEMINLVNSEDLEGNSILHYAVSRKQFESVKLILEWNNKTGNRVEVNATNKKGMTPLNILDILIESSPDVHLRTVLDVHLRTVLLNSGASSTFQCRVITESPEPENSRLTKKPKKIKMLNLFRFKWGRDSPSEARGTLLVVLALIVAITFQAGINPPAYLIDSDNSFPMITIYLLANTTAIIISGIVIDYLTSGFPFRRELTISLVAMSLAYFAAVTSIKPIKSGWVTACLYAIMAIPILLRLIICIAHKMNIE